MDRESSFNFNSPTQHVNNHSNPSSSSLESCPLQNCELCKRGQPSILVSVPTWASIMRVVFFSLQQNEPEKKYFNLKTDVYGFMTSHWDILCSQKKKSDNWHKQIQDMLSHSKNLFESGIDKYKQNGYWRMKSDQDPWMIKKDRNSSTSSRSSNKRATVSSPDDSEEEMDNFSTSPFATPLVYKKTKSSDEDEFVPSTNALYHISTPLKSVSVMDNVISLQESVSSVHKVLTEIKTTLSQNQDNSSFVTLSDELKKVQENFNKEITSLQNLLQAKEQNVSNSSFFGGSLIPAMCNPSMGLGLLLQCNTKYDEINSDVSSPEYNKKHTHQTKRRSTRTTKKQTFENQNPTIFSLNSNPESWTGLQTLSFAASSEYSQQS